MEFSDSELEAIESIFDQYGDRWCETSVDARCMESLLEKIDRYLNG